MIKKITALIFLVVILSFAVFFIYSHRTIGQADTKTSSLHEGMYYEKMSQGAVQCFLCPHRCLLTDGAFGLCKVRKNIKGKLYSMVYGQIATAHVDPIEKKPFFHVLPGTKAFSIATTGCNLRCIFCQNWEISQVFPWEVPTQTMKPEEVVATAIQTGSRSIAFTYSEPIVAYEYVMAIARLAKQKGIKTLMVSGGYIEPEPLKELLKYVDAYKVDFKAYDDGFYRDMTGGSLEPVLKTMKTIKESGVWLEVLNLLIPGKNDSDEQIRSLARWIHQNLGDDVPLHFSRFYPMYKLQNLPPTPEGTVVKARRIATEEGLRYVYTGNIAYPEGESTYCPRSKTIAIERKGYFVVADNLKNGACPDGEKIPGIWE